MSADMNNTLPTSGSEALITRYRDYLPVDQDTPIISLGEGNTPLVSLAALTQELGIDARLYAKVEGMNPTGSFKDRGMTMAISKACQAGFKAIVCASTGNTSASAAAYGAHAGMRVFVIIPEGQIAVGKLSQAIMHNAIVMQITGNFDSGMQMVKQIAQREPIGLVNSVNPFRLQGQKTAAFETIEALGQAPDYHCLPVGNAGNISAYWMGYTEYQQHYPDLKLPHMLGFQAAGAAPFLRGHPLDHPETLATAIRIGNPQSWQKAVDAVEHSSGWFGEFDDQQIIAMQKKLASATGIFCEPASAVSVAGALAGLRSGKIPPESCIVCTLTGHGLKDPSVVQDHSVITVGSDLDAVDRAMRDYL